MVVAHHVAVVGREDDPGVGPGLRFVPFHPVLEPADLGVDEGNLAVVPGSAAMDARGRLLPVPGVHVRGVEGHVVHVRPVADVRRRGFPVVVQVEVPWGRHVRRMGPSEADVEEEGSGSIPPRDVVDRPAHGPCRRMEILLRMPGTPDPRVPVDPVIVRRNVPFFLPAEPLAEVVGYRSLSPAHAEDARVPLVHAGHHGRTGGNAGWDRGVRVGEPRAPGGQVIQIGRFHHRMAVAAQAVASHLVRHDEYDVGTGHGFITYASPIRCQDRMPASQHGIRLPLSR